MQTAQPKPSDDPEQPLGGILFGGYLISIAICLIGNLVVRMAERGGWLPSWGRITLAGLTVIPLIVAAGLFYRMLRRDLDEMLQRILLEGLAFAVVVYVPLAALYLNLRTAGAWTVRLDPPELLLLPALLVASGIALAWRRYR